VRSSGSVNFRRDFLPLRPVVVGVALGAARVSVTGAWRVTRFASGNTGQQNVACLGAGESFRVTAHA
jgi:hypothetical protein